MSMYAYLLLIGCLLMSSLTFSQEKFDSVGVKVSDDVVQDSLLPIGHPTITRVPAISLTTPDPYRKGYFGVVGGGLLLQSRTRITGKFFDPDGNASVSLGLGNPEKIVGFELRVNIYGLGDNIGAPDNLGEGTFDLHFNRLIGKDYWIGAGGFNLLGWDLEPPNRLISYYVIGSHGFRLNDSSKAFSNLYLSLGIGNGRFRADKDYSILDQAPINFIGSAAVQVIPEWNFIVEWNGFNMFSGFAFLPFKKWPIQMMVGVDDIFEDNRKLILAGSLTFHVFQKPGRTIFGPYSIVPPPPVQTSRVV